MDCVNHTGVPATAYCQNCGKAMCATCVRTAPGGQILCEPCTLSWHTMQQPFVVPPVGSPSPIAAGILGIIPGVGAMYNGQIIKGLIHVVIFAVLISITTHYGLFGIFIAAWVLYQAFEAYHTAVARRDGLPLPDPLGLNELGNWFTSGSHTHSPGPPPMPGAPTPPPAGTASGSQAPFAGTYPPPAGNPYVPPPYTPVAGFADPYANPGANPGAPPAPPIPPVPPLPPLSWRRREPIGALILIGFGLLLLLHQMGYFAERFANFLWPLIFIALGAWLIVRRLSDSKGGPH